MLKTRALILAKIETSYGVDPTPTPSANAILCEAPEFETIGKKLDRANVKSYFGTLPHVALGEGLKISFSTELKGVGSTPSTPPEIGVLFRACNFTQTVDATVGAENVKYDPNSSESGESITIYFYQHNILHKLLGCRGTVSLELKTNEYGKLKWEFQGLYAGPADATIGTGTFNATKPPIFRQASFAIDAYSAVIESLKIDVKNEIARRPSANALTGVLEYFIKERAVTGETDPEMVALATKDFWSMWSNGSLSALSATVGNTAGNRCVITAPNVQLDTPKYGDREGILTQALPLIFTPNVGNDEVQFKFN